MTLNVTDAYPAMYMKGEDLGKREITLTIERVEMEDLGTDRKAVAYFSDAKKGLVLNVTNARAIAAEHGNDMHGWKGKKIELFTMPVTFQGKTTDAIRVRPVNDEAPAEPANKLPDDDLDL